MKPSRHPDRLGIHSIGEFHMVVPSLIDAERFYSTFGLRVSREGEGLALRAAGSEHVWGRLVEGVKGQRRKMDRLTFHCFEDDAERLYAHILGQGVKQVAPPVDAVETGLWFYDPDGLLLRVCPGPKTSLNAPNHRQPELPVDGIRYAAQRSSMRAALPQRLSHIARCTPSVETQLAFYTRVLGLRLSDRSGDGVAFVHGPHGSDHHLIALIKSNGPGLHHLSWDVPTVDDVGLGMQRMQTGGYEVGWGLGRHVLGSNYFYHARDPWGSWCEFSATMDYIPANVEWVGEDCPPEDSFYLWGPPFDPVLHGNSETSS